MSTTADSNAAASNAKPSSSSFSSSAKMDDLISSVCSQVGIEPSIAKHAIGAILCFLKEQAVSRNFDFEKITSKLSGAIQLMNEAPKTQQEAAKDRVLDTEKDEGDATTTSTATTTAPPAEYSWIALIQWVLTAGPILDILKKLVGMVFGEGAVKMLTTASDSADLLGILEKLGISKDMTKKMMGIVVKYMNQKLGPDTMKQLADSVPALEPFVEATKKEE